MPTVQGLMHVATAVELAIWIVQFVVWCLVLLAVTHAVWRSFPAQNLYAWLWRDEAKSRHLERLAWEMHNKMHYDEQVARGQQLVQGIALSPDELSARREEYTRLARVAFWKRLVSYLLQCGFCQYFWTAILLASCMGQAVGFWSDLLPTAFGYAGAAALVLTPVSVPHGRGQQKAGGCTSGNCSH